MHLFDNVIWTSKSEVESRPTLFLSMNERSPDMDKFNRGHVVLY